MSEREKCFACDKKLKGRGYLIDTRDNQTAVVGPGCFKKIRESGEAGYQPPLGGPRLYEISQQLLESADD